MFHFGRTKTHSYWDGTSAALTRLKHVLGCEINAWIVSHWFLVIVVEQNLTFKRILYARSMKTFYYFPWMDQNVSKTLLNERFFRFRLLCFWCWFNCCQSLPLSLPFVNWQDANRENIFNSIISGVKEEERIKELRSSPIWVKRKCFSRCAWTHFNGSIRLLVVHRQSWRILRHKSVEEDLLWCCFPAKPFHFAAKNDASHYHFTLVPINLTGRLFWCCPFQCWSDEDFYHHTIQPSTDQLEK